MNMFLNFFLKADMKETSLFSGNVYPMTSSRTVFLSSAWGHFSLFFHISVFTSYLFQLYSNNIYEYMQRVLSSNSRLRGKLFEILT